MGENEPKNNEWQDNYINNDNSLKRLIEKLKNTSSKDVSDELKKPLEEDINKSDTVFEGPFDSFLSNKKNTLNKEEHKALLEKKIGHLETFLKIYKAIIIIALIVFIIFILSDGRNIGVRDGEDAIILIAFILPPTLFHIWILNRFINVITYILKKY